jgi:hypothetical protein
MSDVRHRIELGAPELVAIDGVRIINFDIPFSFDSTIITFDSTLRRFDETT